MFSSWNVRTRRQMISFLYHLAVLTSCFLGIEVGSALGNQSLLNLSVCLMVFHMLTLRVIPISRWIQERLISEAVCFACGQEVELVSQYRCGCGYISPKERHVFSPCPMCGKCFLWIVCPACETSILI